jgi:2-dehydro-3-deoxy-D-arabinonate dehydratase
MKLCRFQDPQHRPRVGLVLEDAWVLDLSAEGIDRLSPLFEFAGLIGQLTGLAGKNLPCYKLAEVRLLPPVERQEVWAAGVTYLRSKAARMEESDFSASAYDRVYEAPRPELFFKAMPDKVVGPGEPVGIRKDARWNVPEPELALMKIGRAHV